MLGYALGIIGLGLALIFGFLPFLKKKLPRKQSLSGAGLGLVLLGLGIGMSFSECGRARQISDGASLRLRFFKDNRLPEMLSSRSIFRWYVWMPRVNIVTPEAETTSIEFTTVFVAFEPDVKVTSLRASSADFSLPEYEVKEFNQRFAIIAFLGPLSEGTLDLEVSP